MGEVSAATAPLAGVRVVDAVIGGLEPLCRYLAELGARVDRLDDGATKDLFADRAANALKVRHDADIDAADRQALLDSAHIIVGSPGRIDLDSLCAVRPDLVAMTVSDFGQGNALSVWNGSDAVLHALSGELSRSGIGKRAPLLPPGRLAYECAAAQGALVALTAFYHALRTGVGDRIDYSALDGAVQALDPGYGIGGSATMGRSAKSLPRERPPRGFQYPIIPCADGHVRICILAPRQWQGMFRWMGEPEAFASPEFNKIGVRFKSPDLIPAIAAFFAGRTRAELEQKGQGYGVPIAGVRTLAEFVASDHLADRGALRRDDDLLLPNGVVTIDGKRMDEATDPAAAPTVFGSEDVARPLAGLKVLDLGVIVVGAETGRLLADAGADVVKLESRAYPDGNRQSHLAYGLSAGFAAGHRNKRSLGLNLRTDEGKALFLRLAAQADIVLSNFKPGTLEALGLDHAAVSAANPRIISVDSSAFGSTGPWSGRMGYGPLVRAATGLTEAWRYPDDPESHSDSITIYPDHVGGRIGALAATALLVRRLRSGTGGRASVAQAEVMLAHFAADVARLSSGEAQQSSERSLVFQAAGEDEWCVVTLDPVRDEAVLRPIIGEGDLEEAVGRFVAAQAPYDAAKRLQDAGIAAAPMLRVGDLPDFVYYRQRSILRPEPHPYLVEEVLGEQRQAASRIGDLPFDRPAPLAGEQTAEVLEDWLGITAPAAADLAARGIVEPTDEAVFELVEAARNAA